MNSRITSLHGAAAILVAFLTIGLASPLMAEEPNPALLDPSLATATAPDLFRVKMETTAGDFVIEVHRDWAPHGADRFYNLVKIGYFNDTAFYRVIKGFMAQVGMNGDPKVTQVWAQARIQDDPVKKSNTKRMVTFAMGSQPNSRTTQIFINLGNNPHLDKPSKFAPFGKVVEGFETVEDLYDGYGEGAPRGRGPSQARIHRDGNVYLKDEFKKLDYIVQAGIVE
ncbi:MAG: peptidylprolyl isomerase [Thermoanaerobaculales bacterium]